MARLCIGFVVTMALMLSTATAAFAQDRGHGSIYYSSSGQRIGWARSLSDDPSADHVARAMCQGGQIDAQSLDAFANKQGGIAGASTLPVATVLNDCQKIIKFDSRSNHQCGGFGLNSNGQISSGERDRDQASVQGRLSSWQQTFIICNDDVSVSGFERFATALGNLASALGGNRNTSPLPSQGASSPGSATRISFQNGTTVPISYDVKCTSEASYHPFSIAPATLQSIDSTGWGLSCSQYDVQVDTAMNDGSQTRMHHVLQAGGPYTLAVDPVTGSFNISSTQAQSAITVINETNVSLQFTVHCPNLQPTTLTVAANGSIAHHLGCVQGGTLEVQTGTATDSATRIYSIANGTTYHLRFDPATQLIVLVPTP